MEGTGQGPDQAWVRPVPPDVVLEPTMLMKGFICLLGGALVVLGGALVAASPHDV